MFEIAVGTLILILGTMFSGKSSELINQFVIKSKISKWICLYFKPKRDIRDPKGIMMTHNGIIQANVFSIDDERPELIVNVVKNYLDGKKVVIFIDEVQFFSPKIVDTINQLLFASCDVYAGGLSSDYLGCPFETVSNLIPIADTVQIKKAVCVFEKPDGSICGKPAIYSQMFLDGQAVTEDINGRVHIGAKDEYKTFCREHYTHNPTKNHLKLKDEVCAVH